MEEKIKTDTILVKEGIPLPEFLQFESEPYSQDWRLVKDLNGYAMDRRITKAGWNFFYMAGEFKVRAFGWNREKTLGRAVRRILAHLKSEKFNCLEITQMAAKRFLGVPYWSVSGNARHIQESVFLFQTKRLAEWDRAKLAAA